MRTVRHVAAAVILASLLAACGNASSSPSATSSDDTSQAITSNAPVPDVDGKAVIEALFSGSRSDSDGGPMTPEEYADYPGIDAVLKGRVDGFATGPRLYSEFAGDTSAIQTVVMKVVVAGAVRGDLKAGDAIYVQINSDSDPTRLTTLLKGALVGLYLSSEPQVADPDSVEDAEAGRPHGQPLRQVGARGLVVADGLDGGVVYPIAGEMDAGSDLDSQLPSEG